jgi:hypothetical protein
MSGICGIDCAPLVLEKGGGSYCIALSGYAYDNRTFGANVELEKYILGEECYLN